MVMDKQKSIEELEQLLVEKEKTIELLLQKENLYKKLIDFLPIPVFAKDVKNDYRYIIWNKELETLYGNKSSDIIGKNDYDLFERKEEADYFRGYDEMVMKGREVVDIASEELTTTYDKKIVHTRKYPVYDENHRPSVLLGCLEDITVKLETEEKLRISEEQYRLLVINLQEMILMYDTEGRVSFVNEAAERIMGYTRDEVIGKKLTEIDIFKDLQGLSERLRNRNQGDFMHEKYEIEFTNHKGKKFLVEVYSAPILSEDKYKGVLIVATDITQKREIETFLKEKTAELDRFFDVALDLLCIAGTDGYFKRINSQWEKALGFSKDELMKLSFLDLVHPDDIPATLDALNKLKGQNEVINFINRYRCKDGSYVWIEWRSFPHGDLIYAAARDISDNINRQMLVEKERTFLRKIIDTVPGFIFVKDINSKFILANSQLAEAYGTTSDNIVGKRDNDFSPGNDEVVKFQNDDKDVISRKINKVIPEEKIVYSDGSEHWLTTVKVPVIDEKGRCDMLLGVSIDITSRKKMELSLQESESKYRNIIQESPMGVHSYYVNESEELIFDGYNKAAERMLAFDHSPLMGKKILDAFPGLVNTEIPEKYYKIAMYGETYRVENVDYDDNSVRGAFEIHAFRPSMRRVIVFFNEISERKRAEFLLKKNEEFMREITENMVDLIAKFDSEGKFIYASPSYKKVLGYEPEELLGKYGPVFIHPDEYEKSVEKISNMFAKGEGVVQFRYSNKKGEYRWIESSGKYLYDPNSAIEGAIMASRDITERKMAELSLIDRELELKNQNEEYVALNEEYVAQNEELAESFKRINEMNMELFASKQRAEESDKLKSAFLANMSHEIRTPMNAIVGFTDLLSDEGLPREKVQKYIEIINTNSHQLLALINDIIDISKIEAGQVMLNYSAVNLNNLCRELHTVFKNLAMKKNLQLYVIFSPNAPQCIAETDEIRLKQIFTNLIGNAIKFTQSGSVGFGYHVENDEIICKVEDTGIGISNENQSVVFERFRQVDDTSTRKAGGTGLGLSISKALIELMGGKIWLESQLGVGTTFYFSLPLKKTTMVLNTIKDDKTSITPNWGNFKILIAEDEEANFYYLEEILMPTKINIIHVTSGRAAVELCKTDNEINIVLMDIKMPEMDGYTATRLIKGFNSEIPIIAQTAYAMSDDRQKAIDAGCNDYLAKPINKAVFIEILKRYLPD